MFKYYLNPLTSSDRICASHSYDKLLHYLACSYLSVIAVYNFRVHVRSEDGRFNFIIFGYFMSVPKTSADIWSHVLKLSIRFNPL